MAALELFENTPAAWSDRAEREQTSWGAAGWSHQGQRSRFATVIDALLPQPGETLLDYGCGTGALSELLQPDVGYVGFDTAPGMVTRAMREHRDRRFQSWEPSLPLFDLVACVGPFNLPSGGGKHDTWHTLRRLWDETGGRALAACLYAGDDHRCLIYTKDEIKRNLGGLSWRVTIDRWRHNDILVLVER